jgi:hypothetical protein
VVLSSFGKVSSQLVALSRINKLNSSRFCGGNNLRNSAYRSKCSYHSSASCSFFPVNALGAIDASEILRTVFAATVRTKKSADTPTVDGGFVVPELGGGAVAFNDGVEVGGFLSAVSAAVAAKSSSESISTASLSS